MCLMILILDGNSENVAHTWRNTNIPGAKKYPIYDCSLCKQLPLTDQITGIAPNVCS